MQKFVSMMGGRQENDSGRQFLLPNSAQGKKMTSADFHPRDFSKIGIDRGLVHATIHAYTKAMKTITLDEAAYNRLKAWKRGTRESFSSVVKRVVPEPGTLGSFVGFVESRGTANLPTNDLLEEAINERSSTKEDPWT